MELQELVSRARLLLVGAPKRAQIFQLVNGKRTTKEIAIKTRRLLSAVLHDLQRMRDMGVITPRKNSSQKDMTRDGFAIYEKHTLLKHLSPSYFSAPEKVQAQRKALTPKSRKGGKTSLLKIPSEKEIIDICAAGEDQLYEFKQAGVETTKLAKEICALANTRQGGFVFYGVDDGGTVLGTDKSRQAFDPAIQNSIKHNITPSVSIRLSEKEVLGVKILVIAVPPREADEVYYYNNVVYIRKGTVSIPATPSEVRKMHEGKFIT